MLSWFYLAAAILLEAAGTTCMKLSQGLTLLYPSLLAFLLYGTCLSLLPWAFKEIELTVAYGIWAGLGAVLVAGIGIVWLHETATPIKLLGIGLIILGSLGLKLGGTLQNQRNKSESTEESQ